MVIKGIVKHFGELIKKAEESIREKMDNGLLDTESSITERFLQGIESIFDEYGKRNGIYFRARSLRDRGPNAPEKKFGADFCGVLDVRLRELELSKGFLVQAKRESGEMCVNRGGTTGVTFRLPEHNRIRAQTEKMLAISPDSFIIVYGKSAFVVIPALSLEGFGGCRAQLHGKRVGRFFEEFITCFIGDPRLNAHDDHTLEELRERTRARSAILFQISDKK